MKTDNVIKIKNADVIKTPKRLFLLGPHCTHDHCLPLHLRGIVYVLCLLYIGLYMRVRLHIHMVALVQEAMLLAPSFFYLTFQAHVLRHSGPCLNGTGLNDWAWMSSTRVWGFLALSTAFLYFSIISGRISSALDPSDGCVIKFLFYLFADMRALMKISYFSFALSRVFCLSFQIGKYDSWSSSSMCSCSYACKYWFLSRLAIGRCSSTS